uniref:Uncharacterized protein n=1 Tax=Trypanosoma vivax (strain Y486) TaxID=1055687 RepID=G0U114_TRYVY|nr:conserved hypothetical protein [Trypanosoma vivax Y486]
MAFFDLVDMTVAYMQYLYMLLFMAPSSFSNVYLEPVESLKFIILDIPEALFGRNGSMSELRFVLPDWMPFDTRLQYLFVVIVIPILVSIMGIFIISDGLTLSWIITLLVSLFMGLFGSVLLAQPLLYPLEELSITTRTVLTSTGTCIYAGLAVIGIFFMLKFNQRRRREVATVEASIENMEGQSDSVSLTKKAVSRSGINKHALIAHNLSEARRMQYITETHRRTLVAQGVLALLFMLSGLFLTGLLKLGFLSALQKTIYFKLLGGFLILASVFIGVWMVLGTSEHGRRLQLRFADMTSAMLLSSMLILMSLVYTPVLLGILRLLWCTDVQCSSGEHILHSSSLMRGANRGSESLYEIETPCSRCNFNVHEQKCPSSLHGKLCAESSISRRLAYDHFVPCDEIEGFYITSIVLLFAAYIVAYPVFLVFIAERATGILEKEYPLEKRLCDEFTETELYYEKVSRSSNVSTPIYEAYKKSFRLARLLFLFQRIILVTVGALVRRGFGAKIPWLGFGLVFCVCLCYFAFMVLKKPYARTVENMYGASHQIFVAVLAAIGLAGSIWGRESVPHALNVFIAVLLVFAPIGTLLTGSVLTFRKDRERVERLQKRLQRDFSAVTGTNKAPCSGTQSPSLCSSTVQSSRVCKVGNVVNSGGEKAVKNYSFKAARFDENEEELAQFNNQVSKLNAATKDPKNDGPDDGGPSDVSEGTPTRKSKGDTVHFHPQTCQDSTRGASIVKSVKKKDTRLSGSSVATTSWIPNVQIQNDNVREARGTSTSTGRDDYFDDKRTFNPPVFFRGYKGVPVSCSPGSLSVSVNDNTENRKVARNSNFFSTLRETWSRRLKRSQSPSIYKERGRNMPFAESLAARVGRVSVRGDSTWTLPSKESKWSFLRTVPGWVWSWSRSLYTDAVTLRYEDILRMRKTLNKTLDISQRPFWLEPSESQKEAFNAQGSAVPWYTAKGQGGFPGCSDSTPGKATLLQQLLYRKIKNCTPIVAPRGAFEKVVSRTASNSTMSLQGSASSQGDPRGGKCRPLDREQSEDSRKALEYAAALRTCVSDAEAKLEELSERCPRQLFPNFMGNRRLSVFARVKPRVLLEGMNVTDWDTFVQQLFDEIADPLDANLMVKLAPTPSEVGQTASSGTPANKGLGKRKSVIQSASSPPPGGNGERTVYSQTMIDEFLSTPAANMQKLRRHHVLRRRLVTEYHQDIEWLTTLQNAVDHRIAITVKKYMWAFFTALGVMATISLVMCVCGMLNTETKESTSGYKISSYDDDLMGYLTWDNFTKNCCCSSAVDMEPHPPYQAIDVEEWVCSNRRVKERIRRDNRTGSVVDGYSVRKMCGMNFTKGCKLKHGDGLTVVCRHNVSEKALERW